MYEIPVFSSEIKDGIADKVRSTASIAYCVEVDLEKGYSKEWTEKVIAKCGIKASLNDGDLYHTKSILATSNWNKNDDIFHPHEMWIARYTPVHKPDNINHDEDEIIGHMIDCWAIDGEGNIIANDTAIDDVPEYYHIVNSSVIYTSWSKEENKEKVQKLIEKIEAGEMFVSMECWFRGFDYGVITASGEKKIIARNKDTAFLTKHLKAYGGTGKYQDMKIGRIMRRMTFSGKGYVEKPANPESVILKAESLDTFSAAQEIKPVFEEKGVLIICNANTTDTKEISDMSVDTNKVLEDTVKELKAEVSKLQQEKQDLVASTSKAAIENLETSRAELAKKLEAAEESLKTTKTELESVKAAHDSLNKQLEEAKTAKASVEEELGKIKLEALKATRVSTLVDGGVDKAKAEEVVAQFAAMTDDQFKVIADLTIAAAKAAAPPMKEEKDEKKGKEGKKGKAAVEVDLENAETDEVDLANAGLTDDDGEEFRKALASQLGNLINVDLD